MLFLALLAAFSDDVPPEFKKFGDGGGWPININLKEDYCSATTSFDNGALVVLMDRPRDGIVTIGIRDPKLKAIEPDKQYKIAVTFLVGGKLDQGWGEVTGIGNKPFNGIPGFHLSLREGPALLSIENGSGMSFAYKGKLIDAFSLAGSRAMVAELRQCAQSVLKAHPIDPFEK